MFKAVSLAVALMFGFSAVPALAQNGESKKAEFCAEVMSQAEIDALREQLAEADGEEAEREVLREHMEEVLQRAAELPMAESPACEYGK